MIKFKGTTLYPPMIFEVLNSNEDVLDYVIEVNSNELNTDDIVIYIAAKDSDEESITKITSFLHARLRVRPQVFIVDIDKIKQMQMSEASRKITRIIDRRVEK
jgi:phenylacetate-CoA ligase